MIGKLSTLLLLAPFWLTGHLLHASSLEAYTGFQTSQHSYLEDSATLAGLTYGAVLNMQTHKLKRRQCWLCRGPKGHILVGDQYLSLSADAHLYQITAKQGIWLHATRLSHTLQATLSSNETFLDNSGSSLNLNSGTKVDSERVFQRYSLYWYESLQQEGPINRAALFYQIENSPAASTLSNNSASLFDGTFSGFGFSLGRIKDDKGLNFQWKAYFSRLDSSFSNDSTRHRSLNASESEVYQLAGELHWHYRYRLAPYWYLVPNVKVEFSVLMQSTSEPVDVNHKSLIYSQTSSWLSLQKRF